MSKRASPRLRRLLAYAGFGGGAFILAAALLLLAFRGVILNGYCKQKAEQAFAKAYPGCVLRIGELDYALRAHCLVAQSLTLSTTNATLKSGRVALTGVRWARLLWGTAALAEVLAQASLDVTNLSAEFPQAHYGLRCARLRASVPGSELMAEGTELKPLIEDEAFFAAHEFRAPRFHVIAPECRVSGLALGELLQGKFCRASSVHFARPSFDALVNRDKPVGPFVTSPLMVHEALAALPLPLQVDTLTLTNGHLTYCERVVARAVPGTVVQRVFIRVFDANQDSDLTHDEFTDGFAKWFSAWNVNQNGQLTEDQLRLGLAREFALFRGAQRGGL